MEAIALVPARAGSKSIKNKNLQKISGQSLIEISVRHAQEVDLIKEVYISSDSLEILELGSTLGCTPINRPTDAATDSATANEVVKDFIYQTKLQHQPEVLIIYLQPTSPFREHDLIIRGIQLYLQEKCPVVAVTEVNHHPLKILGLDSKGKLKEFMVNGIPTANRQSLPLAVIPSGSLYIFTVQDFLSSSSIPVSGAQPIYVSGMYALDIDNEAELQIARRIGIEREF